MASEIVLVIVLGFVVNTDSAIHSGAKTRRTIGHVIFGLLASLIMFLVYATTVWVHRTGTINGFWAGELVQGFSATLAALLAASIAIFTVQLNAFHERHNSFIAQNRSINDRIRYLIDELDVLVIAFHRSASNPSMSLATAAKSTLRNQHRDTLLGSGNALCPISMMLKIQQDVSAGSTGYKQILDVVHLVGANSGKELWAISQQLDGVGQKLRVEFSSIGLNANHLLADVDFICGVFDSRTMQALAELQTLLSTGTRGATLWNLDEQPSRLSRLMWASIYFAGIPPFQQTDLLPVTLTNCINELVGSTEGSTLFQGRYLDEEKFQLLTQHFNQFVSASERRRELMSHLNDNYRSITGFRDRATEDLSTLYELWKPMIDQQQSKLSYLHRQNLDRATQASSIILVEDLDKNR
ncbi:MAG: hypothetical protein NTV13_06920 [Actinobacteria bacterium]|nr:hypothetical protein [Actinomycetota bacterium]